MPHEREFRFRNPGNFCLYNPESGKFLLVQSGIQEIFACTIRNPGNFLLYNPESRKFLLVQSGIGKSFAYGIRNPRFWNPEYVAQGMRNLESSPGRRRFAENTGSHGIFSSNKTIQLIYLFKMSIQFSNLLKVVRMNGR